MESRPKPPKRELLSSKERKRIFDKVYKDMYFFDDNHELFTKSSEDLKREKSEYGRYVVFLEEEENNIEFQIMTERKIARLQSEFEVAKADFNLQTGACVKDIDENYKKLIDKIGNRIGFNLNNLIQNRLGPNQKVLVTRIIIESAGKGTDICNKLLRLYNLENVDSRRCVIPIKNDGTSFSPSTMNAVIQKHAAAEGKNFIFAFPQEIPKHFPVVFCHPIFALFSDIINDRIDQDSEAFQNYKLFIDSKNGEIRKEVDECVSHLIDTVLNSGENQKELAFVKDLSVALKKLFPVYAVKTEPSIRLSTNATTTGSNSNLNPPRMDAVVYINDFPFILFEAKNNAYSMNAVLQGLQYYGQSEGGYIDNDPCFLITLDRGILFIYGVALVNRRVVCSCLLSLEFTSYLFNIDGIIDKLCKCFGALYYFYTKFTSRLSGKNEDQQHLNYSLLKSTATLYDVPYPAIFMVRSKVDPSKEIMIKFQNIVQEADGEIIHEAAYFKPCVYLVKTSDNLNAVLKLAYNYDIEAHEKMAAIGLAPKIIGHEILCGQYQIILMEYLGSSYDTLFNYINKHVGTVSHSEIYRALEELIRKLQSLGIVHGDFRSGNILAKRSSNASLLEDYKIIDFELSGNVDSLYPALALRNHNITWPKGFSSFMPRKFEHDLFMLQKLKENELKL